MRLLLIQKYEVDQLENLLICSHEKTGANIHLNKVKKSKRMNPKPKFN
jgi:hypothetical protein